MPKASSFTRISLSKTLDRHYRRILNFMISNLVSRSHVNGLIAMAVLATTTAACRAQGEQMVEAPQPVQAPQLVDGKIELSATQIAPSSNAVSRKDGNTPVIFLNASAYTKDPKRGGFAEWTFETPLPAGWWHGKAESTIRHGQYVNGEIGFVLISPQAKTSIPYGPHNYRGGKKGEPQVFEFWIYAPAPVTSVRYQPTTDLYRWNETWPLAKLTLEQKTPDNLTAIDALALDVPIKDGMAELPNSLPSGSFWISGVVRKPGTVTVKTEDGKSVAMPVSLDQYGRQAGQTRYFYLYTPLAQISVEPKDAISMLGIQHKKSSPFNAPDLPDKQPLITLFDEKKPQTATLELIGNNLDGSAPTFAAFPFGKKIAVVTTWDDGSKEDLRLVDIFQKHGFHPSFFFNNNSAMMAEAANFEAKGAEVGSHGYGHPFLYQITPVEADFHMVEQRRVLEAKLGHPVISMAYPNGYSTAYDVTGDYVLNAVRKAGYLSGRTTATGDLNINKMGDLLKMNSNGFFGYGKQLVENYQKRKDTEVEIFYFWGHSWQIGKSDAQWNEFETLLTNFADNPEAWYATQGDLSVWNWIRNNTKTEVTSKSPTSTKISFTRPTLHSWLAARVPLAIKVPAGVTQVKWQGKTLDVQNGTVDLPWQGT
jgi:peptidoglycan/xylan/chitin deacetylase (PgdA/CDA1 family)